MHLNSYGFQLFSKYLGFMVVTLEECSFFATGHAFERFLASGSYFLGNNIFAVVKLHLHSI